MKKIILVDGNNLLFRSYYATAYNGNFMNNSKGFPTNALFGFTNMINKIIKEEKPEYILVAFDKGKTFRHDKFEFYKDGRTAMPDELKVQFPIAKQMLGYMGIKYYEIDNYEADDIIGTFSEFCNNDSDYKATIVSSDKDLLQLISDDVDIKLLKQKDYIRYNKKSFISEYGIKPINVIDLKALMGDSSDNIPGVKGVGEKTALKLLCEYKTLDGIYENIDKIKGKLKEKLINDKENAYMSYSLATIVRDVPIDIDIDDIKYKEVDMVKLNALYENLEFYSFLKKINKKVSTDSLEIKVVKSFSEIDIKGTVGICLEVFGDNYHNDKIVGIGIYGESGSYYISGDNLGGNYNFLKDNVKYVYDAKKVITALKYLNIEIENIAFDSMVAASLLDYNVKDDMAYLANELGFDLDFYESVFGKFNRLVMPSEDVIARTCVNRAKFVYDSKVILSEKLEDEDLHSLYYDIELPLTSVLSDMEYTGVCVSCDKLKEMGNDFKNKLNVLSKEIYDMAGEEFNISSPIQLSNVLFDKLGLPHGKKNNNGYSTAYNVLQKIRDKHPIISKILEYRAISKLYSTYIEGLIGFIKDGKIHTIYTQNLTRTGRLSSTYPNLQNIPIRDELGRSIRKAFLPSNDYILSADYSQIELRIMAHFSSVDALIMAFKNGEDIHAKTASDIFKVPLSSVTSHMRRVAKAVNFGIIYGISSFGLGENLDINTKEAKKFIDSYLETYPGIKDYMDGVIREAKEKGFVRTLFNRKRNIPELNNPAYMIRQAGERIALNTPIQGTSADIIKLAMVKVFESFNEKKLKSKMIMQVHDELIFDVTDDELDVVSKIVTDIMENICKLCVPLKVDINYGKDWFRAK